MDILFDEIGKKVKEKIDIKNDNDDKVPSDILTLFYLGAIYKICLSYITDNKKYSDKDILHYLNILIPDNIQ